MESTTINQANHLIQFINQSPSSFHVVESIAQQLTTNGYQYIDLLDVWNIKKGGKYFTTRNDSAIFAFHLGMGNPEIDGFKLVSAHSDSPGFKIKPAPESTVDNHFLKLNTEVYGGPILMSWLDRPLSIAGRVITKSNNILFPNHQLIHINRPLLTIPSMAIHLNRTVNEGVELNKQIDMLPLLGMINDAFQKNNFLVQLIANELAIDKADILDFDLFVYNQEQGCLLGFNNEFISSPRLDDLAMVHAGLIALINSTPQQATNILCIFDNEEVGSSTKQGADSPILNNIIERIMTCLGKTNDDFIRAIYHSFMISADMAHSLHPNRPEKHDPLLHPIINKGPVIKYHAGQKYTTDGDSAAVFMQLCHKANVPFQTFANRSDMVGGSTLGNVSTGQIDMRTVDVGNAMLAMHSARELAGTSDHDEMIRVLETFYRL